MSRLSSDARNRVLLWGTFNLPRRVVVSPVAEWRSGFPYSVINERYLYAMTPNAQSFPSFVSADMVAYKTFTVRRRSADLRVQNFHLTHHRHTRHVDAVTKSSRLRPITY